MGELGELVSGVSDRIADTLDDKAMALTTSLSVGEDRLTQAIEMHTESASRVLSQAHQKIEGDLGQRVNELGTLVGEVGDRIADSMGEHALALTTKAPD